MTMTMTTKRVPNSGQLRCFIFCYKLYYLLSWKLFWIFCPKQKQNLILMAWLHNLFVVEIGKGKEDISQCHRGRCKWWWFVPMSSDGWQGKGIDPPDCCLAAIGGVSRRGPGPTSQCCRNLASSHLQLQLISVSHQSGYLTHFLKIGLGNLMRPMLKRPKCCKLFILRASRQPHVVTLLLFQSWLRTHQTCKARASETPMFNSQWSICMWKEKFLHLI